MHHPLSVLANLVINSYFGQSGCLLIFNAEFDYSGQIPQVVLDVDKELNHQLLFRHYGCQGFIITSPKPATLFTKIENSLRLTDNRFNFRRYLFLPGENAQENILDVLETRASNYVTDILIIATHTKMKTIFNATAEVAFDLFTHKYVGRFGTNEAIFLDRWFSRNQSFLRGEILYPEKLADQRGRILRIATFTYKPYSVAVPPDGTEVLVALEYARKHNMTPHLVVDEKAEWGEIFDDWTGNGILGNVAMDKSDLGLGALYTWEHEYHFLDLSKPISRTGITCITPAPTLLGGWITPFVSFSPKMWLASGVSFLLCTFSIFIVLKYEERHLSSTTGTKEKMKRSLLITEGMFLLQSLSTVPTDAKARVVYGSTLLLCLMLGTLYASGLASNMTAPRYHGTIRTAQNLADANLLWGATSTAWISSIMGDTEPTYRKLVKNFIYIPGEQLVPFNEKRFAFSVERLPGGNFAIGNYVTKKGAQKRRLMNNDIYWEYCVIMTKKSSILLPSINAMILLLSQTGIFVQWEYQVVTRHLDMKIQKIVKYSSHMARNAEPVSLQWTHVEGAFGIWFIGMGFSFICFLVEIYLHRKRNRHSVKMFIPARRHTYGNRQGLLLKREIKKKNYFGYIK